MTARDTGTLLVLFGLAAGGAAAVTVPLVVRRAPASRRRQLRANATGLLSTVLTVAALAAWGVALASIDMRAIGPVGFVTAAPPAYWTAWGLLVVAMCVNLFGPRRWGRLLVVQTAAVVLVLHTTVLIAEPVPRFATGWLHAGFAEYIMRTGETLPQLDARFSWPGFFSATAMLTSASGLDSPVALMRWVPALSNLVYAGLVYAIATQASDDTRLRWVAVWIFLVGNWVGQDYFSPQGVGVGLFLAVVVIVLAAFRNRPMPMSLLSRNVPIELVTPLWAESFVKLFDRLRRIATFADREHETGTDLPPAVRSVLIVLLLLVHGVLVVTHQLTPVALIACVVVLVVTRRCRLSVLPVLMSAMFFGWLSFGAVTYWAGHMSDIFGGIGDIGSSVTANVGTRIGGSGDRVLVLAVRLGFTTAICLLAVVGFMRRSTRPRDRSFVLLATAPFLVLAGNAYGGEALMRAYFYALPFVALYAAAALVAPPPSAPVVVPVDGPQPAELPHRRWPPFVAPVLVGVVLIGAAVPFMMARYGNESFEMVTPGERALFAAFYDDASRDADLVALTTEVAARYREVESHDLVSLEASDAFAEARIDTVDGAARTAAFSRVLVTAALAQLDANPDARLIVTRGQDAYGQLTWSLPAGWTRTLVRDLTATGEVTVVHRNRDGWMLRPTGTLTMMAQGGAPPDARPDGGGR